MRAYAGCALTVLVFVASLAWLGKDVHVGRGGDDTPAFHIDEAHKLGEAFFFHLLFKLRDLDHPAWTEDFYARTNPPVAKYIFGAVLAAAGHPVRDQRQQKDFEAGWQSPEKLRELVPDGMIRVTRSISIVFGAGLCMLVFVIARRAAGTPAGLIAVVLLLGNPSFSQTAQRGLTDTILLLHLALIVPVTLWAASILHRYWQGRIAGGVVRRSCILLGATVLMPGVAIALATGSKLNGWLTGPSYAAGVIVAAIVCMSGYPLWRRFALAFSAASLAGVTAVALFIGINPYFYQDPIGRMAETLKIWGDWMITQQISPGPGLFTIHQRITAVGYYSLADIDLPLSRLGDALHGGSAGTWLTILGFAAGLVYLIGRCLPSLGPNAGASTAGSTGGRGRLDSIIILCWVVICSLGVTLWLPVSWDRHMLPPYLTFSVTTAIGLAVLPRALRKLIGLATGSQREPGTARFAVGILSAVALWILLAFTPWIITPMLLPDPLAWSDPEAVNVEGESHLVHGNIGAMCLHMGMNRDAAQQFKTALKLLECRSDDGASTLTQRCCLLSGLARARLATDDRLGAAEALGQYITVVEQLRSGMKTNDPYVRGGYDVRIVEARAELAQLAETQPRG
jgi:hypothetical protein